MSKNLPDNLENLSLASTPVFLDMPENINGIPNDTQIDETKYAIASCLDIFLMISVTIVVIPIDMHIGEIV